MTPPNTATTRSPIIAVMGHIDHGKSTLLDTIRDTKVAAGEAGGITQHVSAYEVETESSDGKKLRMTFLDTPGHAAFAGVRERGCVIADIAILIVAADDGVQPQTKEALQAIRESDIPFVVAINKIDKNNADIERTKQSLIEQEVYLENYGGSVPVVEISATEGRGIDELLEMIGLVAELQELTGDPEAPAEGYVLESSRDPKRGVSATLIITNGTLSKGQIIVSGTSMAPIRLMEDFLGKPIDSATFSSPVNIVGWNKLPQAGREWAAYENKRDAEAAIADAATKKQAGGTTAFGQSEADDEQVVIPVILKADSGGGIEGMRHELEKLTNERVAIKIIHEDIGPVNENDVMFARASDHAFIIGFNVKVDSAAQTLAQRDEIDIKTFDVIYTAAEWLAKEIEGRTPTRQEKKITGQAKIIKRFSQTKRRQVIGGKVADGTLKAGESVTIYRREAEIGKGQINNLQHQKEKVGSIQEGMEFGAEIESSVEIHPGDIIEAFDIVEE